MATRAFVVGLERYLNPRNNLIGVGHDVSAAVAILGKFGVSNIEVLRDENATKKAIESGLTNLLRSSDDGDVAIFYFSGHGALLPEDFIGTNDEDGRDEALVPYECDTKNLIVDNEIKIILDSYLKSSCFFYGLYDCCHSGDIQKNIDLQFNLNRVAFGGNKDKDVVKMLRIDDLFYNGIPSIGPYSSIGSLKDLVLDNGRENAAHFAACEPDNTALVSNIDGARRSIFTWAMEQTLKPDVSIEQFEADVTTVQAKKRVTTSP